MATRAPPPSTGSMTVTIDPSPSPSTPAPPPPETTVLLRLKRRAKTKKKVSWKEGTVDNESLGRRSSKKCCVFHKEVPFDEDRSDDDEADLPGDGGEGTSGGGCSSHARGSDHEHRH